jgi:hypothetical protein
MAAVAAAGQILSRISSGGSRSEREGAFGEGDEATSAASMSEQSQEADLFFERIARRMESKRNLMGRVSSSKKELHQNGLPLSIVVKTRILAERVQKRRERKRRVILPESNWKRAWDVFVGLMIMYSVIMVPLRVGFDMPLQTHAEALWELCVDAIFLADVAFTFFEAYYVDDVLVTDRSRICLHYMRGWFIVDFLSSLPVDLMIGLAEGGLKGCDPFPLCGTASSGVEGGKYDQLSSLKLFKTLKMARLLKLARLFKLTKLAASDSLKEIIPENSMMALGLLFKIAFLSHFTACAWFWLSGLSDKDRIDNMDGTITIVCDRRGSNSSSSWITTTAYESFDLCGMASTRGQYLASHYLTAVYWTVATLMAVGYGDVYAQNPTEQLFSIAVQIMGAFMFGMIIATITSVIQNHNTRYSCVAQKMEEMKQYMKDRHIPSLLQSEVKRHYEYYYSRKSAFPTQEIIKQIPVHMRMQMIMFMFKDTIATFQLFQYVHEGLLNVPFIVDAVQQFQPFFERAGRRIIEEGDTAEEIIFLSQGTIEIFRTVDVQVFSSTLGQILCFVISVDCSLGYFHNCSI